MDDYERQKKDIAVKRPAILHELDAALMSLAKAKGLCRNYRMWWTPAEKIKETEDLIMKIKEELPFPTPEIRGK